MKRVLLLFMGLLVLSCPVLAYQINIQAPDALATGKPLVVTGTTTFGTGTPIDVVLYFQSTTSIEVQRHIVYVLSDKTFKTVFDTTGLKTGTYKVEVPSTANSDDVTMRLVTIYDRSEDIILNTPLAQEFTGKIYLTGNIKGLENSGVQVEVFDPTGALIFGPQFVHTDNAAHFAFEVPVPAPGNYEVSFTDANGYAGSRIITTASSSGIFSTPVQTATAAPVNTAVLSAHSRASRNAPAFFIVKTGIGPVTVYTSKSMDWVIEYVDEYGILHMENKFGDQIPEKVDLNGRGKTLYFKVYPYKYSVTGDAVLYGENVDSVVASTTVPDYFSSSGEAGPTRAAGVPICPLIPASAAAIALLFVAWRRH